MTDPLTPGEIATCAQAACLLEAATPKPGNVSRRHDFSDVGFEDFLLSAAAIGPAMASAHERGVGDTILQAVRDTRRWTRANTNLGIVLLLAPLARAAATPGGALRDRLAQVLDALTVEDARAAYAAIRLAEPGGLGAVAEQDVRGEPTVTLIEAMSMAAAHDTIAREYATDYDLTLGLAVPALRRAREAGIGWSAAVLESFLTVLAAVPDTLIERKQGRAAAEAVSTRAKQVLGAGRTGSAERWRAVDAFDAELRGPGNRLNPGTTADITAAALFVTLVEDLRGRAAGG